MLMPSGDIDPFHAVRFANYRLFASGFVCSSTGLQMLSAAVLWEVYERTQSAMAIGLVGLCRALPVVALALPAGQIVDFARRERVLVVTQVGMALAAASLAWASFISAPIWVFYALMVLMGCARSFNGPSRSSLLPQLVDAGAFTSAVTWNSGIFQFAAVSGPLLTGAMLVWFGAAWPVYAVTAALCMVMAFTGAMLRPRAMGTPVAAGGGGSGPAARRMSLSGMLDGVRHVYREKLILATITLDLFAVLLGGATALLPIYAKDILHVGPMGYGLLRASPYVGALMMAIVMAYRPPMQRAGPALLLAVGCYGLSIVGFGLSETAWLSAALLAIGGAADNISVIIRHVLVQACTPEYLRGRVSAVNSVFIESSNELGSFESAVVAHQFGPVISAVSGGVGTMVVVGAVALIWPQLRRLGSLEAAMAAQQRASEAQVASADRLAAEDSLAVPAAVITAQK